MQVRKTSLRASMTAEAALAFPVFFYALMAFLYLFQVAEIQEDIQNAISRAGKAVSDCGYIADSFFGDDGADGAADEDGNSAVSELMSYIGLDKFAFYITDSVIAKALTKEYLDAEMLSDSCIAGGYQGLSFFGSVLYDDSGIVDIICSYEIRIPVPLLSSIGYDAVQRVRLRSFSGHAVSSRLVEQEEEGGEEETDEEYVYVTETGSAYHLNGSCTYLKLSVKSVSYSGVDKLRNSGGAKYYPCESCCGGKNDAFSGNVYITTYGNRFHVGIECSRLKRTVSRIPVSEIGNRHPCSKCAGKK